MANISESVPAGKPECTDQEVQQFLNTRLASEVNEELAAKVNHMGRLVGRALPDQVKPFWEFQGQMFDDLDEAFRQMTALETTEAKAKNIAGKLRRRINVAVVKFREQLSDALAERKAADAELHNLALKQFPDLAAKDFIIVGSHVLCAGDEPENDHVTNGHTEPPPKKTSKNNFDIDPPDERAADSIDDWKDPVDPWGQFDPPELPHGLLPNVIEDFAFTLADTMGVDPGGLAMATLPVCASLISDDIKLKMKKHSDDWHEEARLEVSLVGDPSAKKSPTFRAATKPVNTLETAALKQYNEELAEYLARPKEEQTPEERPQRKRYRLDDATLEAAQDVLRYNPQGVLLAMDEESGFIASMDKYGGSKGAGKDRASWLSSNNGGPLPVDRVNRGSFTIPNWSISKLGGIQPSVVRNMASNSFDDGFLQRKLVCVLRDGVAGKDVPAPKVADAYEKLAYRLSELTPPPASAWHINTAVGVLRFDADAQELRNELEARHLGLMRLQTLNKKLAGHIGKLDGIFGRLCVTFHCIEHAFDKTLPDTVTIDTAQRVAQFMELFLLPHALAFYAGVLGLSDDHDKLTNCAGYILAHRKQTMTPRDAQRGSRVMRGLKHREIVELYEQLDTLGWLKRAEAGRRGGPPLIWHVNPRLHLLFGDRAKREKEARSAAREFVLQSIAAKRIGGQS